MPPARTPFTAERRRGGTHGNDGSPAGAVLDLERLICERLSHLEARLDVLVDHLHTEREQPDDAPTTAESGDEPSLLAPTRDRVAMLLSRDRDGDDRLTKAGAELAAIVQATEEATQKILAAAEQINQTAEDIVIHNQDPVLSEQLETVGRAVETIFEASAFQDITGQRINKIVQILGFLEHHLLELSGIWSDDPELQTDAPADALADPDPSEEDDLLNGPQLSDRGISQAEIDKLFD